MKSPTCPCCKYQPRLKKDGEPVKGFQAFEEVNVAIKKVGEWDYDHHHVGWSCPKCGVIFREVKP